MSAPPRCPMPRRRRKPRPRPPMSPSAARIIARPTGWCRKSGSISTSSSERTRVRATLEVERNGDHDRPLRLDGDELEPLSVKVDGAGCALAMDGPAAGHRRCRQTARRSRPRSRSPRGQHQADGPLCLRRDAVHPMRGGGLPPHHLLPRPARRAVAAIACGWKATRRRFPILLSNGNRVAQGDGDGRPPLGRMGGSVPQALLSVRAGRRRSRRPTATASPP